MTNQKSRPDRTEQAVYDCYKENHYNGYVGDSFWQFDPDPRYMGNTSYCPECEENVTISIVQGERRGETFTLSQATTEQLAKLERAGELYRKMEELPA